MIDYRFCTVEDDAGSASSRSTARVLNALHSEAHWEFDLVWNEFAADPVLWVGIITDAGERAFSAGKRPEGAGGGTAGPRPATGFAGLSHRFDLDSR